MGVILDKIAEKKEIPAEKFQDRETISSAQAAAEHAFTVYEKVFYWNFCQRICRMCSSAMRDPNEHEAKAEIMGKTCPLIRYDAYLNLVMEHGHAYASEHLTEEAISLARGIILRNRKRPSGNTSFASVLRDEIEKRRQTKSVIPPESSTEARHAKNTGRAV